MSTFRPDKFNWKLWLGVFISAIALGLACYKVEWHDLVQAIRRADIRFILLGIVCLQLNLILRAWRWQVLLRPLGKFGLFKECFSYYMIGYMSNLLLPLRAGEIIRPYFFGKKNGVSKTAVFAGIVVERLIDMVFLACMLSFVIFISAMQIPVKVMHGAFALGGMAFLVMVLLFGLSLNRQLISKFKWIDLLPQKFRDKALKMITSATESLGFLHNITTIILVSCSTLGIWICGVLTVRYYLVSFGIDVPWYAPIFVIVVTNLGMMVPSSPGFIGVAHFLYVFSLSLFGVNKNTALGFAIVIHGISFVLIVLLGLVSLWKEGLSFSNISKTRLRRDIR
jgi:uncharacterized protein (TIRG00374 family)